MQRLVRMTFGVGLMALIACGGKPSAPVDSSAPADGTSGRSSGSSESSGGSTTSAIPKNFLDLQNFPKNRFISGDVAKDGIPVLTDPLFVNPSAPEAEYLLDKDIVIGVFLNGEAKAYPHNIGWWHEVLNDHIGSHPIVVTYCPLTGTGLVFDDQGDGGASRIDLGVSGLLFNNNLVMYDRRDNDTLYPKMIFSGVEGLRFGTELILLPTLETTWGNWKNLYPKTRVIAATGSNGTYELDRYRVYPYSTYRP